MGEEVADGVLDSVLGPELLEDTLTDCMVDELFARMDTRQRVHEYTTALLEDVVDWIEIDLFDELWDHYVPAMLNSMLEVDEFRQGMLEYAGMGRIKLKKRKGKQALPAKKGRKRLLCPTCRTECAVQGRGLPFPVKWFSPSAW